MVKTQVKKTKLMMVVYIRMRCHIIGCTGLEPDEQRVRGPPQLDQRLQRPFNYFIHRIAHDSKLIFTDSHQTLSRRILDLKKTVLPIN
jgi:hypothetical protein